MICLCLLALVRTLEQHDQGDNQHENNHPEGEIPDIRIHHLTLLTAFGGGLRALPAAGQSPIFSRVNLCLAYTLAKGRLKIWFPQGRNRDVFSSEITLWERLACLWKRI